jgi:cysteinyl-tRNA synthetase
MSTCCLGNHFDIHGGGQDLQFPHHENEIAQSEAATGEKFVNYWMHNGFVRIDDEKMSKSLGNFFTIREVLKQYRAEEVRYFILASHYRSPLNYADSLLDSAQSALARLYTSLRDIEITEGDYDAESLRHFNDAMDEDFNTAEAIAVLFDLANKINKFRNEDSEKANLYARTLKHLAGVLGLLEAEPDEFLKSTAGDLAAGDGDLIESLVAERVQAKNDKNWQRADQIRDELNAMGIELEDNGAITSWRRA